jgi:methionyl-tRNA formyltransferase
VRVLFAGTPQAAVPSLQALLASRHEVVGVLTRADAQAGRGKQLTPSPVKIAAEMAGLPVITGNPSLPETQAKIAALECDAAAVVAYGHLLKPSALALMPQGWFNLHFSLLPRWRGAAPVQWALISGDAEVGVSVFQLDAGMDTGPVFGTQTVNLEPGDTTGTLLPRLAERGTALLVKVFNGLETGKVTGQEQVGQPTLAPKITTEQARINWHLPNSQIANLIRGVTPTPGAWTTLTTTAGEPTRLGIASVSLPDAGDLEPAGGAHIFHAHLPDAERTVTPNLLAPGQLQVSKREVLAGTGWGPIRLGIVQPPGKKPMPATDWARGARLTAESSFQ